jgi:hypothetical protein
MRVRHDGRRGLGDFFRHQSTFGYARGVLRLHMTERHRRWGARAVTVPAVVLKRLSYVAGRNLRFDLAAAPRNAILVPLILAGLTAWAVGFRRGCRTSAILTELGSAAAPVNGVDA